MSVQWTFIAGYLYLEIGIVIIMISPVASPQRWNRFFKSRLFAFFREKAAVYFFILLGVLMIFLVDAVREIRKYSHSTDHTSSHLATDMKGNVKLFRAQRNFYITGFAIFLAFIIRRLVTMLIIQAELLDKSERIIKQAESAKDLAKTAIIEHTLQSAGDAQNSQNMKADLERTQEMLREQINLNKSLQNEIILLKTNIDLKTD